jgi:ankyrin repeat protein
MTGNQLGEAARDVDAEMVSKLLSTPGVQFFINYQDEHGRTPLFMAASGGHAAVTKQLHAARCNVDLLEKNGFTTLPAKGMRPSRSSSLLRAATSTSGLLMALLAASC